ncbi:MAG: DUF3299 domain-containing protein [Methylococcaceae bacterium]|nr:DUF3299 domain-containing protein [Methylococcaceae bacterium]
MMTLNLSACGQSNSSVANLPSQTAESEQYPLLDWSQLTPANWDAMALLKDIDLSKMEDNDPGAFDLLKDVREQWNNAPVIENLDGKAFTMNGYVVPLDGDSEHVKEFLLVPYFGACIHSPPPPSNQVIHVHVAGNGVPFTNWDSFVTVSGILKVAHSNSGIGVAGYQMQADIVKPLADVVP